MTKLSTMAFLQDYDKLTKTFYSKTHLLVPDMHPKIQDTADVYTQFDRALSLHIIQRSTIDVKYVRRAVIVQQEVSMQYGFDILFKLVKKLDLQLGGPIRDLQDFVANLRIRDREPVLDFHLRILKISQEYQIKKDKRG